MCFVDNRFRQWPPQMAIAFPVEEVIDYNTLGWTDNAVVALLETARQGFRKGVDQSCVAVEPLPGFGVKWAVGLEMIELFLKKTYKTLCFL